MSRANAERLSTSPVLRTQSVIGKKRPRPSDAGGKERRTKSVTDVRPASGGSALHDDDGLKRGMYGSFVKKALQDKSNGVSDSYLDLVSQLRAPEDVKSQLKTSTVLRYLSALTVNASLLSSKAHATLIEAVLHLPWTTADDELVRVYVGLVGVIVSLRIEWVGEVVKLAVRTLGHHSELRAVFDGPSSSTLTRGLVYHRVHTLLAHLIDLVPTLPSTIQPILLSNFPPKRAPKVEHVTYVRNALRVSEYCPSVEERVLGAVIEKALQVDVEIQVDWEEMVDLEDDDEDDDDDESDAASVHSLDPFDLAVTIDGVDESALDDSASEVEDSSDDDDALLDFDVRSDDEDDEARRQKQKSIKEMLSKLDGILEEAFQHFVRRSQPPSHPFNTAASSLQPLTTPTVANPSTFTFSVPPAPLSASDNPPLHAQFMTLLSIFDRLILRTHKSRYTQFLLFWYTSLDPSFTDEFQGLLVSHALFAQDQPDVTHVAAASYIGSFVSRANWVEKSSVRNVVSLMCQYLEAQMAAAAANPSILSGKGQGRGGFGIFYAVAQAVFLIFCFRWKDLVDEDEGDGGVAEEISGEMDEVPARSQVNWAPGLDVLERAISSDFNPLKVCSPNVVQQFARMANQTSFLYVYHILQSNDRTSTSSSTVNPSSNPAAELPSANAHRPTAVIPTGQAVNEAELDSFFPFDPYTLRKSSRFIDSIYREWDDQLGDDGTETDDRSTSGAPETRSGGGGHSSLERSPWLAPIGGGRGSFGSGGRRMRGVDDDEVDMLGRSFDGAMSISPGLRLPSRMSSALRA